MKVGCYVRVSTLEQAQNGHSIDEQTERLQCYCKAMGWDIYKFYTDAGLSGGNMQRPALQQMIRDCKKHKIEKVVVYKLDRLSRSQKDTLNLIEDVFLKYNVDFVSMCENFDTSNAFGRAMIGILAVFAQLEREQIKERSMMGREARAKQGKFHGSDTVPIGYNYVNGELIVNEFEKIQVQKVFEWYANGVSPYRIADQLNDAGLTHKFGKWQAPTVRQLLTRKTYLGYIAHKGEWYKGTHEPIINEELFNRVQVLRQKSIEDFKQHNRRPGRANSYLGGFVYCEKCGAKFVKQASQSTRNGEKYNIYYYECASRAKKNKRYRTVETCDNKRYRMDDLDRMIFDEIKKLASDPERRKFETRREDNSEEINAINEKLATFDAQITKLMDLYTIGSIPLDVLQNKINDLDAQRSKLENHLGELQAKSTPKLSPKDCDYILSNFSQVMDDGNLDEVRALISALIDKIVIQEENIKIYWNF